MGDTTQLLKSLRELRDATAAEELRLYGGGSSDGTATPAASGGGADTHMMLIQISALHRCFLALADGLMGEVEAASRQRTLFDDRLDSLRRELASRLDVAYKLQEDLQALAASGGVLHQHNSLLAERAQQLEAQVVRWACLAGLAAG